MQPRKRRRRGIDLYGRVYPGEPGEPVARAGEPRIELVPGARLVELHPALERRDCRNHRLLADFHRAADSLLLIHARLDKIEPAGEHAGGKASEALVRAEYHHIGAGGEV